jgi:hypothetical protein
VASASPFSPDQSYGIEASISSAHSGASNIFERGLMGRASLLKWITKRHRYRIDGFMKNRLVFPSQNEKNDYALSIIHHFETKKWSYASLFKYENDEGDFHDLLWNDKFISYNTERIFLNHDTAYHITDLTKLSVGLSYTSETVSHRFGDQRALQFRIHQQVRPRFNYTLISKHLTHNRDNEKGHTHSALLEFTWFVTKNLHLNAFIQKYLTTEQFAKNAPGGQLSLLLTQKNNYLELKYEDQLSEEKAHIFREWRRGYTFFSHLYLSLQHSLKSSFRYHHLTFRQDYRQVFRYLERSLSASYIYSDQIQLGQLQFAMTLEGARKDFSNNPLDSYAISLSLNLSR